MLALGLLSPLVAVDESHRLADARVDRRQRRPGARRLGAALVIAYVVRFLAIAIGFAQAGLAPHLAPISTTPPACCGARPATLVRTIHLPLARPALAGAALLVFVDCLKELPATLLLRPLNVETLVDLHLSVRRPAAVSRKARSPPC